MKILKESKCHALRIRTSTYIHVHVHVHCIYMYICTCIVRWLSVYKTIKYECSCQNQVGTYCILQVQQCPLPRLHQLHNHFSPTQPRCYHQYSLSILCDDRHVYYDTHHPHEHTALIVQNLWTFLSLLYTTTCVYVHVCTVYKITAGHQSISDHFTSLALPDPTLKNRERVRGHAHQRLVTLEYQYAKWSRDPAYFCL